MRANFLKYSILLLAFVVSLALLAFSGSDVSREITIDYARDSRFLPYNIREQSKSEWDHARKTVQDHLQVWHGNKSPFGKDFLVNVWNPAPMADEAAGVCYMDFDMGQIYDQDPIFVTIRSAGLYWDNGFGGECVILGCYRNDSAFAARIVPGTDEYQLIYLTSGTDHSGNGAWEPGVSILLVEDYDYDGFQEAFVAVSPGRDLKPRILYCIEIESLKIEWSLPVSSPLQRGNFYSCKDSLNPSVIFTTYNTKNGTQDENFTDSYCHIAKVNSKGEVVYNKLLSEEHGGVMIRPAESDTIFYLSHSLPFLDPLDTLVSHQKTYRLSRIARGGEIIGDVVISERLRDMWLFDYGDVPCLYTITTSGRIQSYDSQLNIREESNETNLSEMIGTIMLPGRNEPAYVFRSGNGTDLYSSGFKKLATTDFYADGFIYLSRGSNGSTGKILLTGPGAYSRIALDRKDTFDYTKIFFWEYQNYITLALFILLVAVFITNLLRLRTIRQLKTSQRNLDRLFQSSPEASVYTDEKGLIVDINPRFEDLFGYSLEELKGKDIFTLLVPEREITQVRERYRDLKSPIAYEALRQKKDGSLVEVRLSASPIESEDGIIGYIGQYKDITEIKRARETLKESAARFRGLFEDSPIMLAEEDYSEVMGFVKGFRNSGIDDIEAYLLNNPELLDRFESMIKLINVNKTALSIYGARNVSELKEHFCRFPGKESRQVLARTLGQFAEGQKKFETELTTRDLLGRELHTYLKVSVAPGDEDRYSRVFVSLLDITKLKEAEKALRYSEQKYRLLVEGIASDISLIDSEGKLLFVNDSFAKSFGKSKDELVGQDVRDLFPNDDIESKLSNIRKVIETRREFKEQSKVHIQNRPKWFSVNIQPYQDPAGNVTAALLIAYDITDRRLAEDQVIASQERLRAIINSINDMIFVIDRESKFTFFEQAGKDSSLFAEPANFIGRHISEVMPASVCRLFDSHFKKIQAEGLTRQMDYSLSFRDEIRWYSANLSPLYGPGSKFEGVTAVVREITEQVKANNELKHERDFTRSILETANSLIVCLDNAARIKIFNDECEKVTGYKREEVLEKSWPEIFLPESYRHKGLEDFKAWVNNHPRDSYEGPIITKSGEERTILWSNSAIFDPASGNVTAIAIGQDITLKKRIEEAHRRSERKLRSQFRSFPMPSYTWKREGDDFVLADFNDAAFQITDGKISEVRGIKLSKLYANSPELIQDIHGCFQQRISKIREADYTYQTTGQKKSLVVNYAYVSPDLVMVFTQDITDLKRAREEKIRQAKDIAGGFAHEIRNALFPARGAIRLIGEDQICEQLPAGNFGKYLHMAEDSIKRAIDITNQISQYTRMESEYYPERVSLTNVVKKVIDANLLEIEERGIKIDYCGPEDIAVQANSRQLYQVLNNLLLNSIDALTKVEKPAIFLNWKQMDSKICLEFTDNGEGIPEKNLNRVFDAFFSTKPNNGTGIGLAMARKIIEMYEGSISVSSELKKGATFSIKLKKCANDKEDCGLRHGYVKGSKRDRKNDRG